MYRSLSEENQNKALEFLRLLKRQEIEQIYFTENKIYPKKDTAFQYDKNVIESFLRGLHKED